MPRAEHYRQLSRPILAWDGEGWNYNGRHVYGYLANSDGMELYDIRGLSTQDCLDFFLSAGKGKLNVIFSGSYDFTLILNDVPPDVIKEMLTSNELSGSVEWNGYVMSYVPRKYFRVRRAGEKTGVTIWDVFGFYQSSFVDALEKWLGDCPEVDLIAEGKSKRQKFDGEDDLRYIRQYNGAELRALVKLVRQLLVSLHECGLTITRYEGAGAIAAAMLRKHKVKERAFLLPDGRRVKSPLEMLVPQNCAYFGGRIEAIQYGHACRKVYHYDINSAYPAALVTLPNLARGKWVHVKNPDISKLPEFSLFYVKWDVGAYTRICPFPYRSTLDGGMILYPSKGQGWIWYPEVWQAFNHKKDYWRIEIPEAWAFYPDDWSDHPYEFIREYYERRRNLVNESRRTGIPNGAEKVIKLGLNSLYGKTAQRVGARDYQSIPYAGYITSYTRATLYAAAMQAPDDIIALATDGIFSLVPLRLHVTEEKYLGTWDYTEHDDMILVQSGFYAVRNGDDWSLYSRGFDRITGEGADKRNRTRDYQRKVSILLSCILESWNDGEDKLYLPCTRFCTLKQALLGDKWDKRGQWISIHHDDEPGRALALTPRGTKRVIDYSFNQPNPARGMVKTLPLENYTPDLPSAMYKDNKSREAEERREIAIEEIAS